MTVASAGARTPGDLQAAAAVPWGTVARRAGYLTGAAFVSQSILYLLDVTGVLAGPVGFNASADGLQQDLARFYDALNERQHSIWWSIAIRDTAGPLGYLSLMVLVLALRQVAGRGGPRLEIAVLCTIVGACTAAASDLIYLSQIGSWRSGFQPTPDIVAFGRASEVLDNVVDYLQYAGFVVLAFAFVCLGGVLPTFLPTRVSALRLVAYLEASALLGYVFTDLARWDTSHIIAAALAGLVLGPALAVILGHALSARE